MTRFNFSPSDIGNSAQQAAAPIEHAAAHAAAGMEQGVIAALHAAAEPISPIIQMIMRMPGHLGLMSSVFEAFGNFFFSHVQFLAHLDPSLLSLHAHVSNLMASAHLPGLEHIGIDSNLLPNGAPILQGHGSENLFGAHQDILKDSVALRGQFKVSGQMDLGRQQFETGHGLSTQVGGLTGKGDAISGPMMRDIPTSNHLASSQRLFSDQLPSKGGSMFSNNSTTVASTPQTVPNSMNVSGSSIGQQGDAAPAVGQISDTAPAAAGSQNVSGGLGEGARAGTENSTAASSTATDMGSKQLLADNKGSISFRPTLGSGEAATGYDASYLQNQASTASTASTAVHSSSAQTHALGGLKAQQLSLNGDIKPAAHPASVSPAHLKPDAAAAGRHAYHHSSEATVGHRGAGGHTGLGKDLVSHRNIPHVQYDPARPTNVGGTSATPKAPVEHQSAAHSGSENQADATASTPEGQEVGQAPATTAGAGEAASATYTIRAGDCLWNIAKDHLHSATRWSEIYKMNTDVIGGNPSLIHPGTQINLPGDGSELTAHGTGLEHGEYIVKSGDNLWNISKQYLGDGSKWGEIYKANADVIGGNPDLILPGQHLQIPGADTSTVAEGPAAATQHLASATGDPSQAVATADGSQAASAPGSLETAAAPQTPTQSYAPADLQHAAAPSQLSQAAAPNQLSQAADPNQLSQAAAAPATQVPATVAPAAVAPAAAAAPATPHLGGPGAAAAGELHMPAATAAEVAQAVPQKSVVSSNMAPDLAQFMRRAK